MCRPIFIALTLLLPGLTAHAADTGIDKPTPEEKPAEKPPAEATKSIYDWDHGRFEIGIHATALGLNDIDSGESLNLGGAGGTARYRLARRWGLELGLDLLGAQELFDEKTQKAEVERASIPIHASALFYLFPDEAFQLYGLAGFGIMLTNVRYEELGEQSEYAAAFTQLGVGAQWRLGTTARLDASLRAFQMFQPDPSVRIDHMRWSDEEFTPSQTDYKPHTGERMLTGGMLTIGMTWGHY